MQEVVIGSARLLLGDAREVVPTLPRPALLLADPPYGQNATINLRTAHDEAGARNLRRGRNVRRRADPYCPFAGDDVAFEPGWLVDAAPIVMLWGAHRFYMRLPEGQILVWDKRPTGKVMTQGCGEAAWVNRAGPLRIYRQLWDGLSIGAGYETRIERSGPAAARRVHPTQKPVDLMLWCLKMSGVAPGGMVYDPYMGGGSTGIACVLAGHPFVGIEIEPRYFDAACQRIERAHRHATQL